MKAAKVAMLVMIVAAASFATRHLIHRRSVRDGVKATRPDGQSQSPLELLSSVSRTETGKYDLRDVALLDSGEAWAVGYDGEHVDRIYFSKDHGKTWVPVEVPGNRFTMNAISFVDSQHGWAVGGDGLIIRTDNGGKTWKLMTPPSHTELNAVHFTNTRVGYVAGFERHGNTKDDEVRGSVEILCTTNGGESWRQCYKENEPGIIFQIVTDSELSAFVVLDGKRILKTEDQGVTWKEVSLHSNSMNSIAFAPNQIGWVIGKGCFQRTDDGGRTWQQPPTVSRDFVSRDWQSIAFNSKGIGLAVGDNSTLAITTDNGKTWVLHNSIKSDDLREVRIQNSRAIILGVQKAYSIDIAE